MCSQAVSLLVFAVEWGPVHAFRAKLPIVIIETESASYTCCPVHRVVRAVCLSRHWSGR